MSQSNPWWKVEQQIAAGNFPPIFVTADGRLALDGTGKTLPARLADLYPADVKAAAAEKRAAVEAAAKAEQAQAFADWQAQRSAIQAKIEQHRHERAWRLNGFYVEDSSAELYTYAEIAAWL